MKATDLFNSRLEEFETVETFAKRLYETAKRYRSSLIFNQFESFHVARLLAKYYKEEVQDIISVIRDIEFCNPSNKYRIQWVQCLGKHYLVVERRG